MTIFISSHTQTWFSFSRKHSIPRENKQMRPAPAPPVSSGEPPEVSSTSNSTCSPNICRWQPYTDANDFQDNVAMVLIILFCALICSVVLNAVIRCFLRGGDGGGGGGGRRSRRFSLTRKAVPEAGMAHMMVAPTVVYSAGMKLPGAEGEPECAICLSEFVEGDGVQVLEKCKHGFHVQCIQRWLASNTSCPTCRCTCLPTSSTPTETSRRCVDVGSRPVIPGREP